MKGSTDLCKSRPDVDPLPGPELLEVHVPPDVMLGPCGGREGRVIALANARKPGVTAHTFLKMFRNYPELEQMSWFSHFTSNHTLAQSASWRVVSVPGLLFSNSWAQLMDPEYNWVIILNSTILFYVTPIGNRGCNIRHQAILVSLGVILTASHAWSVVSVHLGLRRMWITTFNLYEEDIALHDQGSLQDTQSARTSSWS